MYGHKEDKNQLLWKSNCYGEAVPSGIGGGKRKAKQACNLDLIETLFRMLSQTFLRGIW